ncbi:MAG: peptidylprolyl isomerase [Patescibacteria group bacterium]|jgi:hypothetical protein
MTLVPRAYRDESASFYPVRFLHIFILVCALLALVGGIFGVVAFYQSHWFTPASRTIARILPLPVALLDYTPVWYYEAADFAAVFDVYGDNGEVLDDPFESGIARAIDYKLLHEFTRERGVTVSRQDMNAYPVEAADLETFLDDTHWNQRQYNQYVIEPLLAAQELETMILASEEDQRTVVAEMESILERIDLGVAFGDLATQYSDDPSSDYAGILGFLEASAFQNGLTPIFDLPVGYISPILEAETYFVVAKVLDEVVIDGVRTQVNIQIITKNKNGLQEVFEDYKQSKTIRNLIP